MSDSKSKDSSHINQDKIDERESGSQSRRNVLKAMWVSPIVLVTSSPALAGWGRRPPALKPKPGGKRPGDTPDKANRPNDTNSKRPGDSPDKSKGPGSGSNNTRRPPPPTTRYPW